MLLLSGGLGGVEWFLFVVLGVVDVDWLCLGYVGVVCYFLYDIGWCVGVVFG